MGKLTDEEKTLLEKLQAKAEAPDEPESSGGGLGRVLNVALDLGDDAQVEKAFRLGLLERPADDDPDPDEPADDPDDAPRRRGFFDDKAAA